MIRRTRSRSPLVLAAAAALTGLVACGPADQGASGDAASDETAAAGPGVVQLTAGDFEFRAPGEIPAGWTTFRMENVGEQDHFAYIYRLPDDVTFEQYQREVVRVFSRVWNRYSSGELTREETMQELGTQLPEWYTTDVVPSGGVALTDAGRTATSTVHLEPGTYAIECYVKTPEGTWHTDRGMIRRLVVTDDSTDVAPPEADVTLTLSSYEIAREGELTAGETTIAVDVTDRPQGLMAHDINLVRLEEGTTVEEVVGWMNWLDLESFRSPAPGVNLGGMESMAPGRTGYFTVDLEPGRYLLVSEGYGARGMVEEVTVEGGS